MEYSEKILEYLTSKNIQPATVAKATGIDKSTLSKWKSKPSSKLDLATVVKISEYLNISVDNLLFGEEKSSSLNLSEDERELLKYYNMMAPREQQRLIGRAELLAEQSKERKNGNTINNGIKMVTMKIADVAAGAGISTPFTIDDAFSPKEFPSDAVPMGADCGVPINGDSMEPNYPNGCIVWVNTKAKTSFGDAVIAILNGEPYFKIYEQDGLHSYNESYEIIPINDQDNFYIFGKAVGRFESEKVNGK